MILQELSWLKFEAPPVHENIAFEQCVVMMILYVATTSSSISSDKDKLVLDLLVSFVSISPLDNFIKQTSFDATHVIIVPIFLFLALGKSSG